MSFSAFVDDLQIITGIDLPIEGLGLTVRQPKVREIAMLGQQNYFLALRLFGLSKEQLSITTDQVTNWTIFQRSLEQKIEGIKSTRAFMTNFLQLFVVGKITIGPRSLIVDTSGGLINIEPEDFESFQSLITKIGGTSLLQSVEEVFNPKNKRAAEIAEKMKKARARLAKVKAAENGGQQTDSEGFIARYIRAVSVATANSLEDVCNMTLLQLNTVMETYLAKEAYDLEIRSRLAGAKSDKQLLHWTMPLNTQDDGIGVI